MEIFIHFSIYNKFIINSFNLIIEDIKGNTIDVSIWSEIVGKYYNILNIGDMIMINNYKTTKYNNKLELKLNPSDSSIIINNNNINNNNRLDAGIINRRGEGKILIIKDYFDHNNNKLIPLDLSSIKSCLLSPDDDESSLNIYGIITYITPILRYNKGNTNNSNNECFYHYRYIRIRDNSTSIELYCLLRSNSQYSVLNSLSLSQHILLTNMYMKSSFLKDGSCDNIRYCYIQSTDYSQYYIYNKEAENYLSSIYEYDKEYINAIDLWYNIELNNISTSSANNELVGFTHTSFNYSLPLILHNKIIRNEILFNNNIDNINNVLVR